MDCRISKITIDIMTRISLADLKGSMKSLVMVAIFLSLADTVFGRNIVEENIFENGKTDRLEDFARIYGAVRWFMPSDEAMEVDWNAFTLHAVSEVLECQNNVLPNCCRMGRSVSRPGQNGQKLHTGLSSRKALRATCSGEYIPTDTEKLSWKV